MSVGEEVSSAFSLTQEALKGMLSQVQYSMAVQDIRYYLNGLLMQTEGDQLRLVATDGHRLAYSAATIEADLPKAEVILPRKTVLELFKLLNQPNEQVSVELLNNQVRFRCNGTVIVSKVVDGKFPDFNRVIPLDNDKIFLLNRSHLLGALERAAILANEKIPWRAPAPATRPAQRSVQQQRTRRSTRRIGNRLSGRRIGSRLQHQLLDGRIAERTRRRHAACIWRRQPLYPVYHSQQSEFQIHCNADADLNLLHLKQQKAV